MSPIVILSIIAGLEAVLVVFLAARYAIARARLVMQEQAHEALLQKQDGRWQLELAALRQEFQNCAGRIMEERTEKLDAFNQKQMQKLFDPFKEKLTELKQELATSGQERASLRTAVQEQLKSIQDNAHIMVAETDKLTSALKGTNKLQGNWGELQLEQALVDCGLVKNENFVMQTAIANADGKALSSDTGYLIPDATVSFPDGRKIFIDSKMSMTAYMRYLEAADDTARRQALNEHLASINNHIKTLAKKNYPQYGNKARPDSTFPLTIMFVGNEGALALALNASPDLWQKTFQTHHIVLTSRMSLYPLLWLVQMSWRVHRQTSNQQQILEATERLIERLEKYVSAFNDIGMKIDAVQKTYDTARNTLCGSSQSVLSTGRRITDMMGKETRIGN